MKFQSALDVQAALTDALLGPSIALAPGEQDWPIAVNGGPTPQQDRRVSMLERDGSRSFTISDHRIAMDFHLGPAGEVTYWNLLRDEGILPSSISDSVLAEARAPSFSGAVAVGLQQRRNGFVPTVRFERRSAEARSLAASLEAGLKGEVDVRFVGRVEQQSTTEHPQRLPQRPVRPGCSISNLHKTAGTIGAIVRSGPDVFALTNAHVIGDGKMPRDGEAILQPGRMDGGQRSRHTVGALFGTMAPADGRPNLFDVAFGKLDTDLETDNNVMLVDRRLRPPSATPLQPNHPVSKVGRSSKLTTGTITGFNVEARVWYGRTQRRFVNQLEITPDKGRFSFPGDSGSLVWSTDDVAAVGLLFAGSAHVSYASPIGPVLQSIGATLI